MLTKKKKNTLDLHCPQPTRPASSQTQQKQEEKKTTQKQNSGVVAASSVTAYARVEVGAELST